MSRAGKISPDHGEAVQNEAGFSLIELLVALAIFSLAALALLESQGQSLNTARQLEMRVLASMVASNREALFESAVIPPPPGRNTGVAEQMQAKFTWQERRVIIPDTKLMRFTIVVSDENSVELARLDAFRRLP